MQNLVKIGKEYGRNRSTNDLFTNTNTLDRQLGPIFFDRRLDSSVNGITIRSVQTDRQMGEILQ